MGAHEAHRDRDAEQGSRERQAADDLRATLGARRDLGPEYDETLADSFVERVDDLVARRVDDELARRQQPPPWGPPPAYRPSYYGPGYLPPAPVPPPPPPPPPKRREGYPVWLGVFSLLVGWFSTATAVGEGEPGVVSVVLVAVTWLGIAVVNGAVAVGTAVSSRRRLPPD